MCVQEVLNQVERDRMFLESSGGGVTVSGGECLYHPAFTAELLRGAHEKGFHTAVESCGFASRDVVDLVFPHVDLALLDIKVMNAEHHKQYTGVPSDGISNSIIHMMILGADPIAAARALKGCIYHVHGKDARIERLLSDVDGILEPRPVTDSAERVWNYVAVGCGHDLNWWKEFFSVVHMMGYDGDVSLEMEDLTMSTEAGVATSVNVLTQVISR